MSKTKVKIRIVRILAIVVIVSVAYYFAAPKFLTNSTVEAIGDLTVNWGAGVSEGDPIFVVNNAAPGDSEARNVDVTNGSPSVRPVGVRGEEVSETGNLASILEMTISVGGTDVYGGTAGAKTVDEFFADSAGPDGIFLVDLNPAQTKTITFTVDFPESAQNEFQDTSVVFDLIIGLSIDLPAECDQIDLLPTPIIGTFKAETLNGTEGNDLIMGMEGADRINGHGGDDCILGGIGADSIRGNSGNDAIFGEAGADSINGNEGDDSILGGNGGDKINGNEGVDTIFGEGDADTIHGNNDNDFIVGGLAADTIFGENGEDQLFGNEAADTLRGGNDNDVLEGGDAPDRMWGENGDDTLRGENGNDRLVGGEGTDSADGGLNLDNCDAETEVGCEL